MDITHALSSLFAHDYSYSWGFWIIGIATGDSSRCSAMMTRNNYQRGSDVDATRLIRFLNNPDQLDAETGTASIQDA